ncbi:MAG: ATP-dependent DNA helicase [Burkholderiaceae bacterium]|nr:ATP-dependent DNA helicase [Burkholderiaceae bacterium]
MSPLEPLFSESGPIARSVKGYRYRAGQLRLAQAIQECIDSGQTLVAEAGTGVGKTFAYLVPLLQSQGKSIVSTATRHLQDQLYERDLPRIKAALGVSIQTAVLKGRANYLCLYRMEQHKEQGRFSRREDIEAFGSIVRFAAQTTTGDIAECAEVPENAPIWSQATSTRENCLGQQCPRLTDCHLMAARTRAAQADLVVINHHLLCADMALRDEGFGELLPTVNHVVIDEAHALPEVATHFFSQSISTQALSGLARDALGVGLQHARDGASWPDLCGSLERCAAELRLVSPATSGREEALMNAGINRRIGWDQLDESVRTQWLEKLNAATDALIALHQVLTRNAERHLELAQLLAVAQDFIGRIGEFCEEDPAAAVVRWMEWGRYGVTMHITPYEIAPRFQQEMAKHQRTWIMVSATLAIAGRFDHFVQRLGLEQAKTLIAESPFDFQQQGLLLVPQQLPDPKAPDLIERLLQQSEIRALLDSLEGGAFILCTSHRAVGHARGWFEQWASGHPDRLILAQGEAPRQSLIERFRAHGAAILIGSHSFWEGVDVPGAALSMVLIDKLPFAPPDDPVMQARSRWLTRQGFDSFSVIQIPEAAILLKQGVGRLIRTETDRGLVVVGDRRLAETGYGRRILRSLPNFARTRDCKFAKDWLAADVPVSPSPGFDA